MREALNASTRMRGDTNVCATAAAMNASIKLRLHRCVSERRQVTVQVAATTSPSTAVNNKPQTIGTDHWNSKNKQQTSRYYAHSLSQKV